MKSYAHMLTGGCRGEPGMCKGLRKFFIFEQLKTETVLDQRIAGVLDTLSPNSQVSLDQLKDEFLKLYDEKKAKMKEVLKHVDGNISLVVDFLSSESVDNVNGSHCMCLTAHFIDDKWILRRVVLDFSPFGVEGNYFPSDIIRRSLRDWEIEEKIWTITSVNTELYDTMFEVLKPKIRRSQLNHSLFRLDCCDDVIKTIFREAVESICDINDKIQHMYPVGDVSTWKDKNSYLMSVISKEKDRGFGGISYVEWSNLCDVCQLVEKVYKLVFPLFGKGYQSANIYFCSLLEVLFYLRETVRVSFSSKKLLAKKMLNPLVEYLKKYHCLLVFALVMDPRLKKKYVGYFSTCEILADIELSEMELPFDLNYFSTIFGLYAKQYPIKENTSGQCASELLRKFAEETHSTNKAVESEVENYMAEPVLDWSDDFDTLTWWKVAGSSKYPILARMARDILAIPFTTAVDDDALLIKQRKIDSCVASADPDLANALMCLRSWLLNQNLDLSSSS